VVIDDVMHVFCNDDLMQKVENSREETLDKWTAQVAKGNEKDIGWASHCYCANVPSSKNRVYRVVLLRRLRLSLLLTACNNISGSFHHSVDSLFEMWEIELSTVLQRCRILCGQVTLWQALTFSRAQQLFVGNRAA
jgi:hypothetical protein